ncbi:1-phosphofructokinase family hexose kinase [Aestuariicoccus sp. MJ-SS9]|uniref:1-phosphofructokinase family hexose kinase n=1 Tax=Aestuariicoccus sp. MJ-SS9 TaxID=3079855 RepID=UPI00291165C2|nr:1-phosphofructokinase family hexose kinase [Aestuariicoccus sp. MJ-SS9]MDU8913403.1 1-phosphofructokinase family hexose kinase [Aestuariicoccus sp. MJ-SS9]
MPEILTITLKPAVDYATSTEHVEAGPKLYCGTPRVDPGGGGVNVARAIVRLGGSVEAFVVVGGPMGDRLLTLLAAENVPTVECRVAGETGYSLAVTDAGSGEQFRFSLPGESVSETEAQIILDRIYNTVQRDEFVVLSGGVANGLPDNFPQKVQAAVSQRNGRLIVDTSKAPLLHLIKSPSAPLDVLRLDRSEIEKAVDRPLLSIAENLAYSKQLVERGVAQIVVCGHGSEGSVMVAGDQKFFCHAPQVPVRSKIGAGDALVGALTLSLARGDVPEQALKWGVAAAAATVSTEGTALFELADTEALLPQCRLERC